MAFMPIASAAKQSVLHPACNVQHRNGKMTTLHRYLSFALRQGAIKDA